MSNINNRIDYINGVMNSNPFELVSESEERYSRVMSLAVEKICSVKGREIIMLAGPSSSGKTTTAGKLAEGLAKMGLHAFTVSLDDFYLNARDAVRLPDGSPDFESVHALDLELINSVFNRLLTEGESEMPHFDFQTGSRSPITKKLKLEDEDVLVVEGLHALNPLITGGLPNESLMKIYISVGSRIVDEKGDYVLTKRELRFVRRMVRDYKFRNSSVENTYRMWPSVMHGEDVYLFPFKDNADLRINSIHLYEPCVFRKYAIELLSALTPDSPHYENSRHLIYRLERFTPVDDDIVPKNSLLREFIG